MDDASATVFQAAGLDAIRVRSRCGLIEPGTYYCPACLGRGCVPGPPEARCRECGGSGLVGVHLGGFAHMGPALEAWPHGSDGRPCHCICCRTFTNDPDDGDYP